MKKLLLIAALAISATAFAETKAEQCASYASLAGVIMDTRQAGAPMADVMKVFDTDKAGAERMRNKVIEAYSAPRMSTEANKKRMTDDFANDAYLECIR